MIVLRMLALKWTRTEKPQILSHTSGLEQLSRAQSSGQLFLLFLDANVGSDGGHQQATAGIQEDQLAQTRPLPVEKADQLSP